MTRDTCRTMGILAATAALTVGLGVAPAAANPGSQLVTATQAAPAPATPSASGHASLVTRDEGADLLAKVRRALGARADDISVVVHDRRSGAVISHNRQLVNSTASIVKVMVLVALIGQRRADGRSLSAGDRSLARAMITHSDNDATSTLLARAGGRQALVRLAARLGMSRTKPASAWGRTQTTAGDQVKLIDAILDGRALSRDADRDYVLGLMSQVDSDQDWGVGTVPSGARAQVKNGWVPLSPRGWRINSIGHVTGPGRDYSMAMLSYDNQSMSQGVRLLDAVSRVVYAEIDDLDADVDTGDDAGTDAGTGDDAARATQAQGRTVQARGDAAASTQDLAGTGSRAVMAAAGGSLPRTAPSWFVSAGSAFPPHPVR